MSVNGILKPWKYLDRVLPNSEIPYIADYVKIACALMNGYWPELVTKDAVMEKQVASKMVYLPNRKIYFKKKKV